MFPCLYWTHIVNCTIFNNCFTLFWKLQHPPNILCNCKIRPEQQNLHHFSLQNWFSSVMFFWCLWHESLSHWVMPNCLIPFEALQKVHFSTFIFPSMITSGTIFWSVLCETSTCSCGLQTSGIVSSSTVFCIIITLTEMLACSRYICKSLAYTLVFFLQERPLQGREAMPVLPSTDKHQGF